MTADNIIDFFKERKHFDGWWGGIEPEIQDEIRQELNLLLRKANEEVWGTAEKVIASFLVLHEEIVDPAELVFNAKLREVVAALEAARQSTRNGN